MDAESLIFAARNAQRLTGSASATVAFIVPGRFVAVGRLIRLAGSRGPCGRAVKAKSYGVLATFKACDVLRYCTGKSNAGAVGKPNKRKWEAKCES